MTQSNANLTVLADKATDYMKFETNADYPLTWCEGCGNFAIHNALRRALTLENLGRKDVLFCFDVGCSGNGSDKMEGYTIHGLHGRVLPLAAGVKIGNHHKKIIAEAGDGATFSEGVGHLVHAIRNDYPLLFIHHDNQAYALTTGQASSLTPLGCTMNSSPYGVQQSPLSHLQMILGMNPSFIARTCSVDIDHMTQTFRNGLNHSGFAFIEVLQTCPTYNKHTGHDWYINNIKNITDDFPGYDTTDIKQARDLVEIETPLYLGQIYHNPTRTDYISTIEHRRKHTTNLTQEVDHVDVSEFLAVL